MQCWFESVRNGKITCRVSDTWPLTVFDVGFLSPLVAGLRLRLLLAGAAKTFVVKLFAVGAFPDENLRAGGGDLFLGGINNQITRNLS
jgi:hypothetical protein